jgi:hypothetical protein
MYGPTTDDVKLIVRLLIATAIVIGAAAFFIGKASAQELYRPVALAQVEGEDTGFWCLTREEINSFSKLAGINWVAEPYSMTLVKGDGGKVVIEFTGLCATSAKVIQ